MLDREKLSIYIHLPFCRTRCNYCDFNTYAGKQDFLDEYVNQLLKEIVILTGNINSDEKVHTVYFGGGTPTLLNLNHFEKILKNIRKYFTLEERVEITSEANPYLLQPDYLKELHSLGVNRLSLGMQSAVQSELTILGRKHNLSDVIQSMDFAHQAGFENINLDLMFGIPTQTLQSLESSLKQALDLKPEHLSIYALTVEAGTPMARMLADGSLQAVEEDDSADMYEWVMKYLEGKGFKQYEISNWAVDEHYFCRHNLQYWQNKYYLGFGAGAHSHYNQKRWGNVKSIPEYIHSIKATSNPAGIFPPAADGVIELNQSDDIQETLMMGLRLVEEGVAEEDFQKRFCQSLEQVYQKEITFLIKNNLLEKMVYQNKQVIRLTHKGKMLGNQVFMQFIDA